MDETLRHILERIGLHPEPIEHYLAEIRDAGAAGPFAKIMQQLGTRMQKLHWTAERPDEPGFYWVRGKWLNGPTVFRVYKHENGKLCVHIFRDALKSAVGTWISPAKITGTFFDDVEWSGPIRPPT